MPGTGLDGLGSSNLVNDYGVLGLLGGEGLGGEGPEIGVINTKLSVSDFNNSAYENL